MNKEVFEKLDEAATEYNMCWNVAKNADREAIELIAAVRARIENDRKTTANRITILKNQIADMGKSETVRRVAAMELSELEKKKITITTNEKKAIQQAIEHGRAAISDVNKIQIRDAIHDAEEEIKAVKSDTLANIGKDFELCAKWLDSRENELSKL
jgi:hypothetical protein